MISASVCLDILLGFSWVLTTTSFISPIACCDATSRRLALGSAVQDIWSKDTLITELFDTKFLLYLKKFYDSHREEDGVSYTTFAEWRDVRDMLDAEEVDSACLKQVWAEALVERGDIKGNGIVTFDTFVRINARLEEIIEDMATAQSSDSKELDAFHRRVFFEVTRGEPVMSFGEFLSCEPVKAILERDLITQLQLERMWRVLPKEPLGSYFASEDRVEVGDGRAFSRRTLRQEDGVRVEAFQSLMAEILDRLLSESDDSESLLA